MLGFQFESKTAPFSVYNFIHSMFICVMCNLEGGINTQMRFYYFFSTAIGVNLIAWAAIYFGFQFKKEDDKEETMLT